MDPRFLPRDVFEIGYREQLKKFIKQRIRLRRLFHGSLKRLRGIRTKALTVYHVP